MIVFKDIGLLKNYLAHAKESNLVSGFVPTMGALHKGHITLIEQAKKQCGLVVCSIFINPTQFNNRSDFQKYPVTLDNDLYLLEKAGADLLFLPSIDVLYPNGTDKLEQYDLGYLETILEGSFRPGHFQGVCQVMSRLLQIIQPTLLFMGQKDYQQCMVVKRLIQQIQLPVTLITCETIREADGLAMSSRNKRLNEIQRQRSTGIYQALIHIKENISKKNIDLVKKEAMDILENSFFKTDYVEIADAGTLEIIKNWNGKQKLVALIAAFQGEIRLIDNMPVTS